MIVLLDKLRHVAGRARGGNVFERLRGLRIEANAWHVLREHGNERQPEALVKIRDELVARHLFELAVVARALLERQMPVHVVGIPPGILQALPEEARLANAADFMTPRDDSLLAVLPHQLAQRVHQFWLHILEPLVVGAPVGLRFLGLACEVVFAVIPSEARNLSLVFTLRSEEGFLTPLRPVRGDRRGSVVSVGWGDRARRARPSFSCAVGVHCCSVFVLTLFRFSVVSSTSSLGGSHEPPFSLDRQLSTSWFCFPASASR